MFFQGCDTPKNISLIEINKAIKLLRLSQGWDFIDHGNIAFRHLDKDGMHLTYEANRLFARNLVEQISLGAGSVPDGDDAFHLFHFIFIRLRRVALQRMLVYKGPSIYITIYQIQNKKKYIYKITDLKNNFHLAKICIKKKKCKIK